MPPSPQASPNLARHNRETRMRVVPDPASGTHPWQRINALLSTAPDAPAPWTLAVRTESGQLHVELIWQPQGAGSAPATLATLVVSRDVETAMPVVEVLVDRCARVTTTRQTNGVGRP